MPLFGAEYGQLLDDIRHTPQACAGIHFDGTAHSAGNAQGKVYALPALTQGQGTKRLGRAGPSRQ